MKMPNLHFAEEGAKEAIFLYYLLRGSLKIRSSMRMRHINICYHFNRQIVDENKTKIKFVPTEDKTGAIMTKN